LTALVKTESQYPPIPDNFVGTLPEWLVYWVLLQLGYRDGEDFTFQSSMMGVRYEAGAAVVDFLIISRVPQLCIRIQGIYWHYLMGAEKIRKDITQRQELETRGFEVVDLDEDDILRDPFYYTKRALEGIDLSRSMTGGVR